MLQYKNKAFCLYMSRVILTTGVNLTLADGSGAAGLSEAVPLTHRTTETDVHEALGRR